MDEPIAATLRIALDMPHVYRMVYIVDYEVGGTATPCTLYGHERLRAFLRQCEIQREAIDAILTRVESGIHYVLDFGHMDKETVENILRSYDGS